MATKTNLVIDQGSDFATTVSVTSENGDVLNLVGYSARGQMRKSYSSTSSHNFTVSVTDALAGELTISLNANASSNMVAGRYVYDVEIETASGTITRVLEGIVNLTPEVTRS